MTVGGFAGSAGGGAGVPGGGGGGGGFGGGGFSVMGAIGGALKAGMLHGAGGTDTSAMSEWWASERAREDLEKRAESKRKRLLKQAETNRTNEELKVQAASDGYLQGMGYKPNIPTSVQQMYQYRDRQNNEAGAIGRYRMGINVPSAKDLSYLSRR